MLAGAYAVLAAAFARGFNLTMWVQVLLQAACLQMLCPRSLRIKVPDPPV